MRLISYSPLLTIQLKDGFITYPATTYHPWSKREIDVERFLDNSDCDYWFWNDTDGNGYICLVGGDP